jgi:hypothetical protein
VVSATIRLMLQPDDASAPVASSTPETAALKRCEETIMVGLCTRGAHGLSMIARPGVKLAKAVSDMPD